MSRNASAARRSSRTARRLGALAVVSAAAAALPLADVAVASAAPAAPASSSAVVAFSLSTHSVAFGSRNTGSATTKKVVFKNTGSKALHPVQVLSAPASVSLSANTCAAAKVLAGGSCTYTVRFAPTAAGAVSASLQVLTAEGTPAQSVAIRGTGVQQLMEHYYYQYTFTNPPVINGVAAPQSFIGTGYAVAGTYATGQTIDVFDITGLRQIGTYRIGAVDNTVALDSALLNTVDVNEYDWGTSRFTAATGLVDRTGTAGLGSEAGAIAGLGLEGTSASFTDHQPAVVAHHS
ncbi:choice-of-anchor D domain-containing protein [Angustibacter sp. McL0619]|uniref:choice-of-anchor D domain-containing protein n=1 Tax=Angustibacter sp. McL0619 TaxID=3415676 RepID=UPI003CFB5381